MSSGSWLMSLPHQFGSPDSCLVGQEWMGPLLPLGLAGTTSANNGNSSTNNTNIYTFPVSKLDVYLEHLQSQVYNRLTRGDMSA
jgi:hypothetical protein